MLKQSRSRRLVILIGLIVFAVIGYLVLNNSKAATNADIDNNGSVGISDLTILAANYGLSGKTFSQGDITGDGTVNIFDFSILAAQWGSTSGGSCTGISIAAGADIASIINGTVSGNTTFCISGNHVLSAIIQPKAGDQLIGVAGTSPTLDGGATGCPAACTGGLALAINGNNVNNVTVKGLLVQHVNNAINSPALGAQNVGSGWDIENNEVAFNATEGIRVGASAIVKNNQVHDNGQLGLSGFQSTGANIESNTIYNNCLGANCNTAYFQGGGDEAGGMKFFRGSSITIKNNNVHDNGGDGIWLDTDIFNSTIDGNTVTNNGIANVSNTQQIVIEVACNNSITNNTVTAGAGTNISTGTPSSAIFLSTSHGNIITGNTTSGKQRGIFIWNDANRTDSTPSCGAKSSDNNTISGNNETLLSGGTSQITGFNMFTGTTQSGNIYSNNHYHISSCSNAAWEWYTGSSVNLSFSAWQAIPQDSTASGSTCDTSTSNKIYWGSWIDGDVYSLNSADAPWSGPTAGGSWDLFEQHAGKKVSIIHYGQPPMWSGPFYPGTANFITDRGAIPMMDMSSLDVPLTDITNGNYDSSIITWANAVKTWGKPFFFRWDWEMNGTWGQLGNFYWLAQAKANPTNYTNAWKHIHDVIAGQGANNVTWVWCPNVVYSGTTPLSSLYPGDGYVDWTCIDGYNWGTNPYKSDSWKSFSQVFSQTYNELLALAPTKPIMIGETASTEYGGSKASWITDALSTQLPNNFPKIKALVWFNWNFVEGSGRMDWPIESSGTAQSAFATGISSSYFTTNSFGSLPALTKVQAP